MKVSEDEQITFYIKDNQQRIDSMYKRTDDTSTDDEEYNNTIAEFKASGEVITHDIIYNFQWPSATEHNLHNPFNEQLT